MNMNKKILNLGLRIPHKLLREILLLESIKKDASINKMIEESFTTFKRIESPNL